MPTTSRATRPRSLLAGAALLTLLAAGCEPQVDPAAAEELDKLRAEVRRLSEQTPIACEPQATGAVEQLSEPSSAPPVVARPAPAPEPATPRQGPTWDDLAQRFDRGGPSGPAGGPPVVAPPADAPPVDAAPVDAPPGDAAPVDAPPVDAPEIPETKEAAEEPPAAAKSDAPERLDAPKDQLLAVIGKAISSGVEERMPTGVAETFQADGQQLFTWLRVRNKTGVEQQITVEWKRAGQVLSRVELRVGPSAGWRTWSRRTIGARDVGDWFVDVLGPDGQLLTSMTFTVKPGKAKKGDLAVR